MRMTPIFHQLLIPKVFQNGLTSDKIGHPISANQSVIVVVLNGSFCACSSTVGTRIFGLLIR